MSLIQQPEEALLQAPSVDLSVDIGGLRIDTPIMNASGTFNPTLFSTLFDMKKNLGAIVTKTATALPRAGNSQPRTVELPSIGMLNSIGLQNMGLEATLASDVKQWASFGLPLIVSLSAESPEAFAELVVRVESSLLSPVIAALEINLSCPNIAKGGIDFGGSAQSVGEVIRLVCAETDKAVFAKLTPNVSSVLPMAEAALDSGANGLVAINTVLGLAIDVKRKKPILPRISGGYSGPGIRPIALHHIWQLHQRFPQTAIIGVGGIETLEDVLAFMLAGASAVQVGTSCFADPMVFERLNQGLVQYCAENGLAGISELCGLAHRA